MWDEPRLVLNGARVNSWCGF